MGYKEDNLSKAQDDSNKFKDGDATVKMDRSCTDILCCFVFLVFLVGMVILSVVGFQQGDPLKILTPFDSNGNRCGFNNETKGVDLTDYPYKYFSLTSGKAQAGLSSPADLIQSVCVKSCPAKDSQPECKANSYKCPAEGKFPHKAIFESKPQLGKYCIPYGSEVKDTFNEIYKYMNGQFNIGQYMTDLMESRMALIIMMVITLLIAIIYIFLLKWFVKPLLYTSMLIILLGFILLGGFCYMELGKLDEKKDAENIKYLRIGAIVSWAIAAIYLCFICCCYKNIALGASIMEAASDFVGKNLRVLFLPVLSYIVSLIFMLFWVFTTAHLYSIGEPEYKEGYPFANIKWSKEVRYAMWYYFFGLFWCVAFIICLQQFMICVLTCMWYFFGQGGDSSDSSGNVSVIKAMHWGVWYHCGSIAFGSFIIAVVTMIRVIFEYVQA